MSKIRMPYQCLQRLGNSLLAARGSSIDSFSLQDGSLSSTWACPSNFAENKLGIELTPELATQKSEASSVEIKIDDLSPPAKKRKLVKVGDAENNGQLKQNNQKQKDRMTPAIVSSEAPAIIALEVTERGQHVIVVTGHDKSIRVLEKVSSEDGTETLKEISQRAMPKRPCSIKITTDSSTIISADKFGDVYSLPLIPQEAEGKDSWKSEKPTISKSFTPTANELTIHTERNRRALEMQKRNLNQAPEKPKIQFEHKLLLGHVSMLTDLALGTNQQGGNFILTADRDEHIRISRGIPNSHIIEGYCLGHTDFITRLCIAKERNNLLISGGGEDDLFVWEWETGRLVSRANLKSEVVELMNSVTGGEQESPEMKIVVSGLFSIAQDKDKTLIIVTCERIPGIFIFFLTPEGELAHFQTLRLPGNALAIVADNWKQPKESMNRVVVSIDTIHKPGSITELRDSVTGTEELPNQLYMFKLQDEKFVDEKGFRFAVVQEELNNARTERLASLLYNLENLRKREGDTADT